MWVRVLMVLCFQEVCEVSSSFTQAENTRDAQEVLKYSPPESSPPWCHSIPPSPRAESTSPRHPALEPSGASRLMKLPPHIDPDVFQALPEHIQVELLASFQTGTTAPQDPAGEPPSACTERPEEQARLPEASQRGPLVQNHDVLDPDQNLCLGSRTSEGPESRPPAQTGRPDVPPDVPPAIPPDVDPLVFSQLPSEVQRELLAEWRQQKPVLKLSSRRAGRQGGTRERRPGTASRPPQNHGLLRFFKPR